MRGSIALLFGLAACAPDPGDPFWAIDPIALYPDGEGVYGLQTWELFGEKWGHRFAERWYICSVVVEFVGDPATACEECTASWEVSPSLVESDCPEGTDADPHFLTLAQVGVGEGTPDVEGKDPHPDATTTAWADYGDGWALYGWAYAQALDEGAETGGSWDGIEPFALWPAFAWEMTP